MYIVNIFLSPYLHPISSALCGKTPHQCRVCIGLYTLSSRWGLHMGCHIMKGVSKRCIARLLLTLVVFWNDNQKQPIHLLAFETMCIRHLHVKYHFLTKINQQALSTGGLIRSSLISLKAVSASCVHLNYLDFFCRS